MLFRTAALLLFYALLIVGLVPVVLFALVSGRKEFLFGIGKGAMRASRAILGLRVEVEGSDPPAGTGPFVYMANHASLLDGPLLFLVIPRPVRIIMKASIFRIPVVGRGMRHAGFIPLDRKGKSGGRAAVERAAETMREGKHSFLIFPEGTRSLDGRLQALRRGGFFLARAAGAPIVPVSISGTFEIMPKKRLVPRRGTVRVRFHPPVADPGPESTELDGWMTAVRRRLESIPD